ncbi:hypothetical protein QUF80_23155, partial [Desulfococcaceae bacterium HSG8]|nr:hypothetical protein [Desulfococcaceae bacterium HSG8]
SPGVPQGRLNQSSLRSPAMNCRSIPGCPSGTGKCLPKIRYNQYFSIFSIPIENFLLSSPYVVKLILNLSEATKTEHADFATEAGFILSSPDSTV